VYPAFFFDFLTLEGGTDGLSWNIGNRQCMLRKIPEEHSSELSICWPSPKYHFSILCFSRFFFYSLSQLRRYLNRSRPQETWRLASKLSTQHLSETRMALGSPYLVGKDLHLIKTTQM
jgi:hypothetical protein